MFTEKCERRSEHEGQKPEGLLPGAAGGDLWQ